MDFEMQCNQFECNVPFDCNSLVYFSLNAMLVAFCANKMPVDRM